jgi:hypothetical protein
MGATSVTGVGDGRSEHISIGVSKLIGPRWDDKKEEQLKKIQRDIVIIAVFQLIQFIVFMSMLTIK